MNDMNKLVLGISFYSIKVQFAKRIRIQVHGIILSLQVHIKPKYHYYFVFQKSLLNCLNEWGFLSTQISWDHEALLLSSF